MRFYFVNHGANGMGAAGANLNPSQIQIANMIVAAAKANGVPPELALGIASHESGFNAGATNKNKNGTTDWGVMQLNDTTVQTLGVSDPLDPGQNINAGVALLGRYLTQYGGDQAKALQAYASGPGTVASGASPNAVASQFIGYVEGYVPQSGIDLVGGNGTDVVVPGITDTPPEDLANDPTLDAGAGEIDSTMLLVGAGVVGLMLMMAMKR